ncbi:hypothetical protein CDAR_523171 [Caerostris darwini]|uniref:Uncharacterized protein n=1 Tax=Caerostris darwini TaxID=1538125 RepID=A0AAV4U928_9ARAC|nr:hypothetical protein CDAR_523171 [Caerostris darwini]
MSWEGRRHAHYFKLQYINFLCGIIGGTGRNWCHNSVVELEERTILFPCGAEMVLIRNSKLFSRQRRLDCALADFCLLFPVRSWVGLPLKPNFAKA